MSCLYRSLSYFLKNVQPNRLRNILCDYISSNPTIGGVKAKDMIYWESGIPYNQYVRKMRNSYEWGGAIEIKVFCDIFKVNTLVLSIPNRRKIEFLTNHNPKNAKWIKIYWTGNHFEPIR